MDHDKSLNSLTVIIIVVVYACFFFYLLCILFFILCSWLETNTPHYYSECVRVLGPLMEQGLEKTKSAAIFISENTAQFILWVKEKTPQAIEWVRLLLADFRMRLIECYSYFI